MFGAVNRHTQICLNIGMFLVLLRKKYTNGILKICLNRGIFGNVKKDIYKVSSQICLNIGMFGTVKKDTYKRSTLICLKIGMFGTVKKKNYKNGINIGMFCTV